MQILQKKPKSGIKCNFSGASLYFDMRIWLDLGSTLIQKHKICCQKIFNK